MKERGASDWSSPPLILTALFILLTHFIPNLFFWVYSCQGHWMGYLPIPHSTGQLIFSRSVFMLRDCYLQFHAWNFNLAEPASSQTQHTAAGVSPVQLDELCFFFFFFPFIPWRVTGADRSELWSQQLNSDRPNCVQCSSCINTILDFETQWNGRLV
jgi:hypothetical protein